VAPPSDVADDEDDDGEGDDEDAVNIAAIGKSWDKIEPAEDLDEDDE
jgi:hypothetical protein